MSSVLRGRGVIAVSCLWALCGGASVFAQSQVIPFMSVPGTHGTEAFDVFDPDGGVSLSTNPAAAWIRPVEKEAGPVDCELGFTVNDAELASATLELAGKVATAQSVPADVHINGVFVGSVTFEGGDGPGSTVVFPDISDELVPGSNRISLTVETAGGLVFSGKVEVYAAEPAPVPAEPATPAAGELAGLQAGCVGFVCRPRGDLDSDTDLDLDDYWLLLECFDGVGSEPSPECEYSDFDCDDDVDLRDAGQFQLRYGNPF